MSTSTTLIKLRSLIRENMALIALTVILAIAIIALLTTSTYDKLKHELRQQARDLVLAYGLPATFFVMVLAGTALPMASPLIVAFCSSAGLPAIPLALVAAVGYTLGLTVNYALGYALGLAFVEKRVRPDRFKKLSAWFNKWGLGLVALFGLVPATPFETLSLICGAFRTSYLRFVLVAFAAKLVQFFLFALLGEELAWLIWE